MNKIKYFIYPKEFEEFIGDENIEIIQVQFFTDRTDPYYAVLIYKNNEDLKMANDFQKSIDNLETPPDFKFNTDKSNMTTTDEILKPDTFNFLHGAEKYRVKAAMIEYARIHVQRTLEATAENVDFDHEEIEYGSDGQVYFETVQIDKKTILNAYPESNLE